MDRDAQRDAFCQKGLPVGGICFSKNDRHGGVMPALTRVPARFRAAALQHLDVEQFAPVLGYADGVEGHLRKGEGLFLAGPPGVGKTYALWALTRAYVAGARKRPDYEFVTLPDFVEKYEIFGGGNGGDNRGTENGYDEYRGQRYSETYETIPWLVLNDLGKEYRAGKLGDQITYKLGRLLRVRSEHRRVTHVTTNLVPSDLVGVYGESVVSLLREMCIVYEIQGKDRRGSEPCR